MKKEPKSENCGNQQRPLQRKFKESPYASFMKATENLTLMDNYRNGQKWTRTQMKRLQK